jgi:high affinity Mn2+ porin
MEAAMASLKQIPPNNRLSRTWIAEAAFLADAGLSLSRERKGYIDLALDISRRSVKFLLAVPAAAIIIASAGSAAADEIFVTKAPPIPNNTPSRYNWSGFYAGGHLGYAWGNSNWTASSPRTPNVSGSLNLAQPIDSFSETGSFLAGLQAGYNYMLPNRFVVGGEVDTTFPSFQNLNDISIGGTSNFTSPTLGAETYSETVLASGTVRGRVGYAPGSWLFYATGGFAWTYNQQALTEMTVCVSLLAKGCKTLF